MLNNGVDLAREDRARKCDMVIEQFDNVLNSQNFVKLTQKNNEVNKCVDVV